MTIQRRKEENNMLDQIFTTDRRLRIENKKIINSFPNSKIIINTIDNYLKDYANYYNLNANDIINIYYRFLDRYSKNIIQFVKTGLYPTDNGEVESINRMEYDVSLILSPTISFPRFKIFSNIYESALNLKGNTLIIGIGSGLELEFLKNKKLMIDAYDINITQFVKDRFVNIKLFEKEFVLNKQKFSNIIAIELLEHLSQPDTFLLMCNKSLLKNGLLITTTATNIPQVDHLYNFTDDNIFERQNLKIGFAIVDKETIAHNSIKKELNAKNTWYILKKT